jgi:hypothetical protein
MHTSLAYISCNTQASQPNSRQAWVAPQLNARCQVGNATVSEASMNIA